MAAENKGAATPDEIMLWRGLKNFIESITAEKDRIDAERTN